MSNEDLILQKLSSIENSIGEIKADQKADKKEFLERFYQIDKRFDTIDKKFAQVDERCNQIEVRLTSFEVHTSGSFLLLHNTLLQDKERLNKVYNSRKKL